MKKVLIIGGGFGGCTAIHEFNKLSGWHITLSEPSGRMLGGGVRTRFRSGHPFTYGPRHFLTHNEKVFEYINSHVPMRLCKEHEFISFVEDDSQFYSYPIHYDDIHKMPEAEEIERELESLEHRFKSASYRLTEGDPDLDKAACNYEDFWIKSIGNTLYSKFIETYTKKMWMIDDNKLIDDFTWSPKGVAIKKGPKAGWDTAISAYPIAYDGYNRYFDTALELCDELIEMPVSEIRENSLKAKIGDEWLEFDIIINTSPLDDLFPNRLPNLKYIGRKIEYVMLPVEYALPRDIYFCYYVGNEPYTRLVEYKKFTQYASPHTLISIEYPTIDGGKYYPMPSERYKNIYREYANLCHPNMLNIGRLGLYNYRYDIDDVIEQVLSMSLSL